MGFRYINPGYPRLFGVNQDSVASNVYNPINGVVFGNSKYDGILYSGIPDCDEIWIKAGVYFQNIDRSSSSIMLFGLGPIDKKNGWYLSNSQLYVQCNNTYYSSRYKRVFTNTYYDTLIHAKKGSDGFVEVFVDGVLVNFIAQNITWDDTIVLKNCDNWANTYPRLYLSNVIISDTEIKLSEQVYVLSSVDTFTDMESGTNSGLTFYTANQDGQYLQKSIDTNALTTKVGSSNLRITGLGVGSFNTYREGEGLTRLAFTRNNEEKHEIELTTNNLDAVLSSWDENNLSVADLSNLKLGWKAKE